jgi:hypothetical protein
VYGHDLEEEEEDKVIVSAWLKLCMKKPLKKRERTA